jgi:hypothetical protein
MSIGRTIAAAALLFATAANADFREVVAGRFSSNPENLIINLPPRPAAWPGAVFTYNMRFPIKPGDTNDPALHRGEKTSIQANDGFRLDGSSKASLWSFLRIPASVIESTDVVMSFADAQAVDMTAPDLLRRAETADAAAAAGRRGQIPLIVNRAYVGTPIVTITRKADASPESWGKVQSTLEASAQGKVSIGDVVSYAASEPIVFAFEVNQISFDPTELSRGRVKVSLAPLPASLFAVREQESDRALSAAESAISAITGLSAREIEQRWIFIDAAKPNVAVPLAAERPGPAAAERAATAARPLPVPRPSVHKEKERPPKLRPAPKSNAKPKKHRRSPR